MTYLIFELLFTWIVRAGATFGLLGVLQVCYIAAFMQRMLFTYKGCQLSLVGCDVSLIYFFWRYVMFVQAVDRGFVCMFELFGYVVEAVFNGDLVEVSYQQESSVIPVQREIRLEDGVTLQAWLEAEALDLVGFDPKGWEVNHG